MLICHTLPVTGRLYSQLSVAAVESQVFLASFVALLALFLGTVRAFLLVKATVSADTRSGWHGGQV